MKGLRNFLLVMATVATVLPFRFNKSEAVPKLSLELFSHPEKGHVLPKLLHDLHNYNSLKTCKTPFSYFAMNSGCLKQPLANVCADRRLLLYATRKAFQCMGQTQSRCIATISRMASPAVDVYPISKHPAAFRQPEANTDHHGVQTSMQKSKWCSFHSLLTPMDFTNTHPQLTDSQQKAIVHLSVRATLHGHSQSFASSKIMFPSNAQISDLQYAVIQCYKKHFWNYLETNMTLEKQEGVAMSNCSADSIETECIPLNKSRAAIFKGSCSDKQMVREGTNKLIKALFSFPEMQKYKQMLDHCKIDMDMLRLDLNSGLLKVNRSRLLSGIPVSDWKLIFLGTGSMYASRSRSTSSFVFQRNTDSYDSWLFDCGEGIQLSASMLGVRPGKFSQIFLSHLHGDHCLGLLSILALRSAAEEESDVCRVIDVYGPEGLRNFLRSVMQLTFVKRGCFLRIHELKNVPMFNLGKKQKPQATPEQHIATSLPKELVEEERDIYPDEQWRYVVLEKDDTKVTAIPIRHTVPTVGYIIEEVGAKGQLDEAFLHPIVKRNLAELKQWPSLNDKPLSVYKKYLRNLSPGESFTFPDGTIVTHEQIMKNIPYPRKVVFCQDTCDAGLMIPHAQNTDVLIHEATNSNVAATSDDEDDASSEEDTEKEWTDLKKNKRTATLKKDASLLSVAFNRGHSTPSMAGKFAALICAKRLVLTHFSQRYKGDSSLRSVLTMQRIEAEALDSYNAYFKTESKEPSAVLNDSHPYVIAAWDGMVLPVPKQTIKKM